MFALHYLASAFSSGSTDAIAIDVENNSISTYLKEEPPSLNSTITTDAVSGMVLSHVMEGLLRMSVDDKLEAGLAERWEVPPTRLSGCERMRCGVTANLLPPRTLFFPGKPRYGPKPHRSMRFCCTPSKMAVR